MKFVCAFCFLLLASTFSQAQDACEGLFPYEEGVVFELTSYDKKDKVSSVAWHEIRSVNAAGDGLEAEVISVVKDPKGKDVTQGSYKLTCQDGVFVTDVSSIVNPGMTQAYASMEMTLSGDGLQFPNKLEVGQDLPDGNTKIQVSSSGIGIVTMNMLVKDRKVVGKESLTTDAGTFECYKITHSFEMDMSLLSRSYDVVEWFAPGVGMVRQENYRNGKLESYTLLTKFEK